MGKRRLTKSIVEALRPGSEKEFAWDTEVPGFGAKIAASGRRTYFLKYRTKSGVQRKPTIGVHGAMTCDQARAIARKWYMEAKAGKDPSAERIASRTGTTMNDLCNRYMEVHAPTRKKKSSMGEDEALVRRFIRPRLGTKRVADLTRKDVSDLHNKLSATPYQANRTVALLSHMFTVAGRWGMRPDGLNPCKGVERFPEKPRDRHLTPEEVERLFAVLDRHEHGNPAITAYFKLAVHTGARRSELRTLKWDYVDLNAKRIRLPDSKTGAKTVILTDAAAGVLAKLPRVKDDPHVFPGRTKEKPMAVDNFWKGVRAEAKLEGVRLHDLRHTFASLAIAQGVPLAVIGGLLGHRSVATTARYAHLLDDTLRAGAEKVASAITINPSRTATDGN